MPRAPLEQQALIVTCSLPDALAHCRSGAIVDAKTEIALGRLAYALAGTTDVGARPA